MELIDRKALLAAFNKSDSAKAVRSIINAAPTVDAVEVVRGKWVEDKCYITCGKCGYVAGGIAVLDRWNFCPSCGAKMEDGECLR